MSIKQLTEINRKRHIQKFISMVSKGVVVNEKGELNDSK